MNLDKKRSSTKANAIRAVIVGIVTVSVALTMTIGIAFAENEDVQVKHPETYTPEKFTVENMEVSFTMPYMEKGYDSIIDYLDDLSKKREDSVGIAHAAIEVYGDVITNEQKNNLGELEESMVNATSIDKYNKYKDEFDKIIDKLEKKLDSLMAESATTSYGSSSGSSNEYYCNDPYNFRQLGVLNDGQYRYTYYSSNVLYHYKTSQWTAGSDGIYRDSNGRVIVASDDYPQGTIVNSPIFGECIVQDTGVGSSGTLDVYTKF